MAKLRWELRAAHREAGEACVRKAIEHIENCQGTGGPTACGRPSWYARALANLRLAEAHFRISEES